MSTNAPSPPLATPPPGTRVAIVTARFNADIVDALLVGCRSRLLELGLKPDAIQEHRVPGAFELPVAAASLAATKKFAAVICLGCIIRGDTPHFDFIAAESARGIQHVAITHVLPVIFGVLTTNTHQQAVDRTGGSHGHSGKLAAEAAIEMISVISQIAP